MSRAFLEAYKATKLRRHLLDVANVEEIVDFQNFPVFPRVGITTCIVTLRKTPQRRARFAKLLGALEAPFDLERQLNDAQLFSTGPIAKLGLASGPWVLVRQEQGELLAKIDAAGTRLDQILLLGQGMQTGANEVFGDRTEEEIADWAVPKEMYFQRASNTDIQRYCIHDRHDFILYLEDASEFSFLPKNVRRHLQENESKLRGRAAFKRGNCDWWRFTWPLHKEWRFRKKLLSPYLAKHNRFAMNHDNTYLGLTDTTVLFDNGQPEDLRFLLALLNSRLLTFRFWSIGKLKSGGIYEYFWNSVSKLPLRRTCPGTPSHDDLVEMVDRMHQTLAQLDRSKTAHDHNLLSRQLEATDRALDRLVYELYMMTPEEISIVEKATENRTG